MDSQTASETAVPDQAAGAQNPTDCPATRISGLVSGPTELAESSQDVVQIQAHLPNLVSSVKTQAHNTRGYIPYLRKDQVTLSEYQSLKSKVLILHL